MNQHKRIRRLLAALLSVAMVMGWLPVMETASADTITLTTGSTTVTVTKIAAGKNNSIALKSDGTIIAWGKNIDGWAKPPEGLTGVVDIYAKDTTFMARRSNGTIVAWGSNTVGEATIPSVLNDVISMASAGKHTLVVSKSGVISGAGTVIGWGLNGDGQAVVPTAAQAAVTQVAAGTYYSMALKFNGTVVDWGSNGSGATSMPADLSNVVAIDAGYLYALALKSDGTVAAWGKEYNGNGILNVTGLSNIQAISANSTHALALKSDGTVVAWGNNLYGQTTVPAGLADVVAIAAGDSHSLALKRDGTVVSWGEATSAHEVNAVPGENVLSNLTVSGAISPPAFTPSTTEYQYNIDPGATSVNVNAVLKDAAYSALYINDQLQTSGTAVKVSVPTTGATIKVKVVPYLKPQEAKTYTLKITRDRVAPVVALTPNGNAAALKSVETTVQVTDATSGVDTSTLEYAWAQSASAPASGWARFSFLPYTQLAQFTYAGADGYWYLYIRAKDYAGNSTEVRSNSFLIDNTAPVLTVTMKTSDGNDYSNDAWTNKDVVITAAASDASSTSVTVKYTLDGGKTWTNYTGPITIAEPGIQSVIVQASDATGNVQTDSRTVKISKGDLKLTIDKVKVTGGGAYSSGEWTNSSVRVTATAETGDYPVTSFTWSLNGEDQGVYSAGAQIFFFTDGMNSGEFKVSDSLGNSLTAPYAVNIDRMAPTVSFSPNGNASPARDASVTATVTDNRSGVVESSLAYVWTQSTAEPTEGWLPLNNGSILTKEGVNGNWYLHIQGKDAAGNEVDAVSDKFVLTHAALDSTLGPDEATFDLKASAQADVITEMALNGNELQHIFNGSTELSKADTDDTAVEYTVAGSTVTILKSYLLSYLASQPEGTASLSLTFKFSDGADQTLKIHIVDTTPANSAIEPDIANFDKNTSAQADVVTTMTLNGNTLEEISNGGDLLALDTDYTVDDATNKVTILKSYLTKRPLGASSLKFTFSKGEVQTLILMISDTTPSISMDTGSFDKKTPAQVETELTLNGNTLMSIGDGSNELNLGADYTMVSGPDNEDNAYTVTIMERYLATRPEGTTTLTFTFLTGNELTLKIEVSDSREPEATPSIAIDYVNEELTGFEVGGSYTINGSPVLPVGGKLDVGDYLEHTLAIVKKGDGTTTDSAAQHLEVPARPATPTATGVNPTTVGGEGKITGVTSGMEYRLAGGTWADVAGTEIASLAAGTYEVRVKATATSFHSVEQTITLTAFTPGAEATPSIAIDYANEELTGFEVGGSYTIDGTPVLPEDGKLRADEGYLGRTLALVKKGDGTTTDSAAQHLEVPARPAVPTATGVNPTTVGGEGKITGVTSGMEYRLAGGVWADVAGTEIASLAAGTYEVRVKATATSFHGVEQTIMLTAFTPGAEATPSIAIDYVNEELTGFKVGGSYTIDGTPVLPVGGKLDVEDYLGRTLAIVKKGDGTTTDSAAQYLEVPARPAAPTATGVNPTTVGGEGKITGVTSGMEYRLAGGTWADVAGTEIASLAAAGIYEVRVKATATSFKSAAQTITLTDPAPATHYTVTVNDGGTGVSGSGDYAIGDTVSIQAGTRSGYSFHGWTSTDGVTFVDAGSAVTTFSMIAQNVAVRANWQINSNPTGGNGGGSSSAAPSGFAIVADKRPNQPTIASVNLTANVDKDGSASATITESQIKAMIDAAQNDSRNKGNTADGIGIAFNVLFGAEVIGFNVEVEEGVLALLKQEGVKLFAVSTALVNFSFDQAAIQETEAQSVGDVAIAAHPVTELSDAAKALIGGRPVFDLTVSYEKNDKSEYVTDFGTGTVALGIFYKATSDEKTDNLFAVYVNKSGKPQQLTGSGYDNGELTFSRSSLSTYGVGYLAPAPTFSDTTKHWAKDDIEFVVGLGLIAGTSETTFSPNTAITRGDFLMALGKLSGADVSEYKQSSFSDISGTSTAMPYIEWAVQNKIVQGVGNNRFSPDSPITREQMAVMMARFAQATGYALPVNKQAVAFADGAGISAWAKEAVKAIQQSGIVQGKDNNRYDPAGTATRGEAATILRRFVEYVID